MSRLLLVTAAVLLMPAAAWPQSVEEFDLDDPPLEAQAQEAPNAAADLAAVEDQIVRRTNRFRQNEELEPLSIDPQLQEAARYFADYMARTQRYGHTADGQRPSQRAEQHGYEFCLVLENIGYQYSSAGFEGEELARRFVRGWRTSPEHREAMLDPYAVETAVAVAQGEDGSYFAVQMFGRPREASIHFKVSNRSGEPVEYIVSPIRGGGDERTFDLAPRMTRTHQRCRPATVQFAFDPSRSITVEDGAGYVVDRTDAGEIVVRREEMGAELTEQDSASAPSADR